jgi:pyrroloquinoline quinone (PQQ) biosynthesis protein C
MSFATDNPLAREAFESRLVAAAAAYPLRTSRFFRLVASGHCPPSVLRRYAASCCLSAHKLFATFSTMITTAPDAEAKLVILENLMEEQGIHRNAEGLQVRPARAHDVLARRFLMACGGAPDDAIAGHHATEGGRRLLSEGRWLEGVSFLLIGQEMGFSEFSRLMLETLKQYGFSNRDLAFFAVHIEADCAHGRQALDLVMDRARTRAAQEACITAANDGARAWFEMHGGASTVDRRAA